MKYIAIILISVSIISLCQVFMKQLEAFQVQDKAIISQNYALKCLGASK